MLQQILDAGFMLGVDVSGDPDLPRIICPACAEKALGHVAGFVAAYCAHTKFSAYRAPPRSWRVKGPMEVEEFFIGVMLAPGLIPDGTRDPDEPVH